MYASDRAAQDKMEDEAHAAIVDCMQCMATRLDDTPSQRLVDMSTHAAFSHTLQKDWMAFADACVDVRMKVCCARCGRYADLLTVTESQIRRSMSDAGMST